MPEQPIEDFTTASGIQYGDIWHIQRRQGGVWRDFQVRNRNMFGLDISTLSATYGVQALISGSQAFAPPVSTNEVYLPMKAYAVYTPGNTTDGAAVRLIGHISYEAGGVNGMCCSFLMNGTAQGGPLRASHTDILISGFAGMNFRITDPTTADGTIRVFAAFAIVPV